MDDYVTNAAWRAGTARADTIDEIADQFERPSGADAFWNDVTVRRAAREMALAPRRIERRAG
jgi:hypothetical protein